MKPEDSEHGAIREALDRLNALLRKKDLALLDDFAAGADMLLIGSEAGEVVEGPGAMKDFIQGLFALPVQLGWEWQTVRITREGDIAWLFANGEVVVREGANETRKPYRMTGVLERRDGHWIWRLFHGSEPAT